MQVHLAVVAGQSAGQQFTVEVEPGRPVLIGRASSNPVAFPQERSVSSHHAEIRLEPQGLFLLDRNSTNGIYIEDQRVPHCPIHPGLVVRFGRRGPTVQFQLVGPGGGGGCAPQGMAYGQSQGAYGAEGGFPPAQGGPPPGAYGQPSMGAPPCGECGAPLGADAFQCMSCGRPLCGGHYDPSAGSCQACSGRR